MARERKEVETLDRPEGKLLYRMGPKSVIMGHISDYKGTDYLEIRTWVKLTNGWIRTQKGFNIPADEGTDFIKKIKSIL